MSLWQLAHRVDFRDQNNRAPVRIGRDVDCPRWPIFGVKPRGRDCGGEGSPTLRFRCNDLKVRAVGLREEVRTVAGCVSGNGVVANDRISVLPCEVDGSRELVVEQERRVQPVARLCGRPTGDDEKNQHTAKSAHRNLRESNHALTIQRRDHERQRNRVEVS